MQSVQTRMVVAILLFGALALLMGVGRSQPASAVEIDADQVNKAIERGVAYLKREQNSSGGWAEYVGYQGGTNAMATLALLSSGVPVDDPVIQKALKSIRQVKIGEVSKTYIVALQTMVLCAAEPEKDQVLIRKNVDWLEKTQLKGEVQGGSWSYPGTDGDNSNSQFALLALHEAERVGIKVSDQTWKKAYDYWRRRGVQNQDGSWGYQPHQPGTGSMTCAGIAALIITAGKVTGGDAKIEAGEEQCCGRGGDDEALQRGLDWLGEHINANFNPAGGELRDVWHYYYLYGLERAGRLSSRRFFGKDFDWYREGAEVLLPKQDPLSGFWRGPRGPETNAVLGTSYALLFLSKGRRPVVVGKLEYGNNSDWNNHRQDLAQLTTFTEEQWKRDLTWQVIKPKSATVEDLLGNAGALHQRQGRPGRFDGQRQAAARIRQSWRLSVCRTCVSRWRRFRSWISAVDGTGISREGISITRFACSRSCNLANGISCGSQICAKTGRHRLRLPHLRGLLPD